MAFAGNQSLNGILYRARLTGNAEHDAWLAGAALVGIVGLIAIFRAARAGRQLLALSLTACTTLLISPVSWSHHWVWSVPIVLTGLLAAYRAGNRAMLALFGGGLVLFLASPQWWFPGTENREMRWAWWEQVIGSAYVWAALGALVVVALGHAPRLLPADPQ
jgi:alpha-1,2-mannosyltransferase